MCGARIDEARCTVTGQRYRLSRCVVRQTQDHQVNSIDHAELGNRVLALLDRQAHQFDVIARDQTLTNLESGRSVFAVDKNFRLCHLKIPFGPR